jgi:hypothetical protein
VKTNITSGMTNFSSFGMEKQKAGFGLMPRVGEPDEIALVHCSLDRKNQGLLMVR